MTECVVCMSLLDVREQVSSVYICRERVAKDGSYTSPGEQRSIAVEWHDHTDGWKGRTGRRKAERTAEREEQIKSWTAL